MNKDSFVFHRDWYDAVMDFDDDVRLEVFDAIFAEAFDFDKRKLSSAASIAMKFIIPQIKRDREKYDAICRRNAENGVKGGRPKKTQKNPNNPVGFLETQRNPEKPKKADNDIQDTNVSMSISNNIEREEKDTIVSKKKSSVFVPPSEEEVDAYIKEKGYHFNAENFVSHYASVGWMIGKNKMKDWRAACRTWENRRKQESPSLFNAEENGGRKELIINGVVYR